MKLIFNALYHKYRFFPLLLLLAIDATMLSEENVKHDPMLNYDNTVTEACKHFPRLIRIIYAKLFLKIVKRSLLL